MLKSVRKSKQINRISYALMLFFMLSQSLAADFECPMEMSDHEMTSTQSIDSNNPHAGHSMQSMGLSMDMDSNSQAEIIDCCDHDCQCADKTCTSSNAMITHVIQSEFNSTQQTSFFNKDKPIQSQATSALYRPPIFC